MRRLRARNSLVCSRALARRSLTIVGFLGESARISPAGQERWRGQRGVEREFRLVVHVVIIIAEWIMVGVVVLILHAVRSVKRRLRWCVAAGGS